MLLKELLTEKPTLFADLRTATIKKIDELVSSGQTVEDSVNFLKKRSKVGESVWKSVYKHYKM